MAVGAPAHVDPFALPLSIETDPFAAERGTTADDPFAPPTERSSRGLERDPFAPPLEPAEALARSLAPVEDPFAPPPKPRSDASGDSIAGLSGQLELVGPLDVNASAQALGGPPAPKADLDRFLGSEATLAQTPWPAAEQVPEEPAHRNGLAEVGSFFEAGSGGGVAEARAFGPSRQGHDSRQPVVPPPAAHPPAAPSARARERRPGPGQASSAGTAEAQRSRASTMAAALSLAFLVEAAAVAFVAWRGSSSLRPGSRAPAGIEAEDVSAGPYDTAAGTTVLVVRGRVSARERVARPVRVEAQLWDRGSLVATAEGIAGGTATPDDVYAAGRPGGAEELRRSLDARAAAGLEAGESAPFLVLFPPPAPELRGRELRVVASAGAR